MGAEFNYYIHRGAKDELEEYHNEHQSEMRATYGNDTYAGHIGIMPGGIDSAGVTPFPTRNEAVAYLDENHCKWDCAMAVPFKGSVQSCDARSKRIIVQRQKAAKDLVNARATIMSKIKSTKSKTIGCKYCGSAISRRFLHGADCPVCKKADVLLSKTQVQKLQRLEAKLKKLRAEPLNRDEKAGVNYVVGGWCSA